MPDFNLIAAQASTATAIDTQTNATATATVAAPGANLAIYVTSVGFGYNGTPAAAVQVTLADGDGTSRGKFEQPAAAGQMYVCNFQRPLKFPANKSAVLTLPAGGASIRGTAFLHYFVAQA